MPDDRDRHEPPIEDSGMRRILADVRAALGREPAQVERRTGYHGPGTRERKVHPFLPVILAFSLGSLGSLLVVGRWTATVDERMTMLPAMHAELQKLHKNVGDVATSTTRHEERLEALLERVRRLEEAQRRERERVR
jgi:hypothetical protein